MISAEGVTVSFGERVLFQDATIKFLPGNCYGLIGANGAGKSTFLKVLSGEIEPDRGSVVKTPGHRIAVLKQNQFEFDSHEVLETVLMGNRPLYQIMQEKNDLYAKEDFSEADGMRASELEATFADMGGWDAESQAGGMLEAIGVKVDLHQNKMKDLSTDLKIRVLLAQALFGNPDILLLDEPTNNLDVETIAWLEEFLCEFKNTVIVVSHDRHFLDKVCTHTADIDFGKIQVYTGAYTFWYEASQLALKQRSDQNRKTEEKVKELKSFIERFSANASKSKQATARKKMLSKLSVTDIKPSTRKYPHIVFQPEREAGKDLLTIQDLKASEEGVVRCQKVNLNITKGEKVAFVGRDTQSAACLLNILAEQSQPDEGSFKWGVTTTRGYFPKEHDEFFNGDINLIEWLRQFAKENFEREEEYIRGFLGKMLFSGQEVLKKSNVLSGGEKVRCMLAKIMMTRANVLILDEPTNHLDLESITALNNGLIAFKGTILFISQDREFIETVANRIVEVTPKGLVDRSCTYNEYLEHPEILQERNLLY